MSHEPGTLKHVTDGTDEIASRANLLIQCFNAAANFHVLPYGVVEIFEGGFGPEEFRDIENIRHEVDVPTKLEQTPCMSTSDEFSGSKH
jgi:hypothetical protein